MSQKKLQENNELLHLAQTAQVEGSVIDYHLAKVNINEVNVIILLSIDISWHLSTIPRHTWADSVALWLTVID